MFDFTQLPGDILLFAKLGMLALIALYGVFTFVVFIQVRTMNNIISQHLFSTTLLIVALIQMLAVLALFVFALIIL